VSSQYLSTEANKVVREEISSRAATFCALIHRVERRRLQRGSIIASKLTGVVATCDPGIRASGIFPILLGPGGSRFPSLGSI